MAIVAGDLKKYLTGASSDGGAQTNPNSALGNYRSSTEITDNTDNNLFDDVSGSEASAGDTEYRCICLKNTHGTLSLQNAKVWVSTNEANASTTLSLALEVPTGGDTNGYAQTIGTESTAPTVGSGNVSAWYATSALNSYANGIAVNQGSHDVNLDAGEIVFVWIKRVISANAAAASGINFTIRLQGDTAA